MTPSGVLAILGRMTEKKCSQCKLVLPIDKFGFRKDRGDWRPECNGCRLKKAIPSEKECPRCEVVKPISKFPKKKRVSRICHECTDGAGWGQGWHLKKKYGLTQGDYNRILAEQDGKCAICETTEPGRYDRFRVDHCHETNKVRGLLCDSCNLMLGKAKDDPEILRRAVAYLE